MRLQLPSRAGRCQATWAGTFVGLAGRWAIHTTPSSQRCQHGAHKPQTNWLLELQTPPDTQPQFQGISGPGRSGAGCPSLQLPWASGPGTITHHSADKPRAPPSNYPNSGVLLFGPLTPVHHRSVVQLSCCRIKLRTLGVEAWASFMLCLVCNPLRATRSLGEEWAGGHVCFSSLDTTGSLRNLGTG